MELHNENSLVEIHKRSAHDPDFDVWDPPFERWLHMADMLLADWPNSKAKTPSISEASTPEAVRRTN